MSLLFYPSIFENMLLNNYNEPSMIFSDYALFDNEFRNLNSCDIQSHELANSYIFECDVAGIPREALEITLDNKSRIINVYGKIDEKKDDKTEYYTFSRNVNKSFRLPKDVDMSTIKSKLSDGIVRIIVNKNIQVPKVHQIQIN